MARYRFTYHEGTNRQTGDPVKVTVCETSYAGVPVRGRAFCCASDTYNKKLGEEIAQTRADIEVQKRRLAAHRADVRSIKFIIARYQEALEVSERRLQKDEKVMTELLDLDKKHRPYRS